MACTSPVTAYYSTMVGPNGKRSLVFNRKEGLPLPIRVPCGYCMECRVEKSRQWAIRCVHESQLHDDNCFITLTYSDENLPSGGTLVKSDFQKFMKRLRRKIAPKKVRYFQCGEYGEELSRPHYHACLFGFDPPDRKLWTIRNGNRLYESEFISKVWKNKGHVTVGDVTFNSAAYIARYIIKKIVGKKAEEYYSGKEPEYITMSRRPGIAKGWFDKYKEQTYYTDSVVHEGTELAVPKYYDKLLKQEDEERLEKLKEIRLERYKKSEEYENVDVAYAKYLLLRQKFDQLVRGYENEKKDIFDI